MTGYTLLGLNSASERVITIRVKNALALAKNQSKLASGLSSAASLLPGAGNAADSFIEGQAYEAIAQKINESLAAQKADAEVKVIDGTGIVPQPKTFFSAPPMSRAYPDVPGVGPVETDGEIWKFTRTYGWGVAAGLGLSGAAGLIWHYFFRTRA